LQHERKKKLKNLVKFYKLQKHEPSSKKLASNNHLKKQEANGEGTIALSQMSFTFQLPLKKSGHHFCSSSFMGVSDLWVSIIST
jgi:hypothetical protein